MKKYNNAFELIYNPVEAKLMLAKGDLMNSILDSIKSLRLNQAEAANIMLVSQPKISNLHNGMISKFSLELLFRMNERIKPYSK